GQPRAASRDHRRVLLFLPRAAARDGRAVCLTVADAIVHFRGVFASAAAALSNVDDAYLRAVVDGATLLAEALSAGHRIFVFGNGGSAADAQHIAAELVGRFARERGALPVIALSTNPALLTAWSNDK